MVSQILNREEELFVLMAEFTSANTAQYFFCEGTFFLCNVELVDAFRFFPAELFPSQAEPSL